MRKKGSGTFLECGHGYRNCGADGRCDEAKDRQPYLRLYYMAESGILRRGKTLVEIPFRYRTPGRGDFLCTVCALHGWGSRQTAFRKRGWGDPYDTKLQCLHWSAEG